MNEVDGLESGGIGTLYELADGVAAGEQHRLCLARAAARLDASKQWALDGALSMRSWLAHRCRLSGHEAGALLRLGHFLERFSAVAEAAERTGDDRLPLSHVELLRRMVRPKFEDLFTEHQSGVVEAIALLDHKLAEAVCGEWQRRADAMIDDPEPPLPPERSLSWSRGDGGAVSGSFVLNPEIATQLTSAIETAIRWDGPADARPLQVRRADALFDVLAFFNANHDKPGTPRNRPHVEMEMNTDLTVRPDARPSPSFEGELPFDAPPPEDSEPAADYEVDLEDDPELTDEDDAETDPTPPTSPARRWRLGDELPGFPHPGTGFVELIDGLPVSEAHGDALSCDCVIHRIVRSGASRIDYGRGTRSVPLPLFRVLARRDGGCRFPGCDRPVAWCDAHHIKHWKRFGPTRQSNLVLLCARHHHLVHGKGWHIELSPDATLLVTTPDGRTLTSRPRCRLHPTPVHDG